MILASAWWVKSVLYVAAGLYEDLRRRAFPITALAVGISFGASSAASGWLKEVFDRTRPDAAGALVDLPASDSFPSGHATTAFASAVTLAMLAPRWRWPALALAALISYSRVYLGVHYWTDIIAGALLGAAIGAAVALLVLRGRSTPRP